MIKQLFTISDSRIGSHNAPWAALDVKEAEGLFFRTVNDRQKHSAIAQYPEDFDLWHIGEFDTQTGKIQCFDTPQHVRKAHDVKTPDV